ncbi:hypothetical protein [Mucilaginibacter myungsuensis]|uniref:Uncharacterized protein n=1 Tax=Mucilaginibacter myungsuensis TaxID=649104 RepID=A0A929KSD1_9SPHI|nr:hypothetical protein [Mucilaginibacter myungsuensis]MBE9660624.1 hypothetical protein [Mucilaginibacter myungsuensis]MDN3600669.1 hypothetical protein [Mucilaginibacter myungsuensis]
MKTGRKTTIRISTMILTSVLTILTFISMAMRIADMPMEYVAVANESFSTTSKFEIDLYSGNADMAQAKETIWISLACNDIEKLTNGHYSYSNQGVNTRKPFEFYGAFIKDGQKIAVKSGNFDVILNKDQLEIDYKLGLVDGSKLKGRYQGKCNMADRRNAK